MMIKKLIYPLVITITILFITSKTYSQNYIISFAAIGLTTNIDSVRVENINQGITVLLNGSDSLHLIGSLGVNEITEEKETVNVYPNPMQGQAVISFYAKQSGSARVLVYDINGKTVVNSTGFLEQGIHKYKVSGLRQGMYFINIVGENYSYITKLISQYAAQSEAKLDYLENEKLLNSYSILKSTNSALDFTYETGDVLILNGYSGNYISTITDVPTSSKTITFTFAILPTVTTDSISIINDSTASVSGFLTDNGGDTATLRGFCYGTFIHPTTANSNIQCGNGMGAFTANLTGLTDNMTYYVRAYATNTAGTAYGNELSFVSIPDFVCDIDSNKYNTVKIGSQFWLKQNLKVSRYRNGDTIPNISDATQWVALNTGAYCNYNNNITTGTIYGKLYNFYTVVDSRKLCPIGWHVPSDTEWTVLTDTLGGLLVAGGKLKEAGTTHWQSPNTAASNLSGFTALPGGIREENSFHSFEDIKIGGYWWTSSECVGISSWVRYIFNQNSNIYRNFKANMNGNSVRCLKDVNADVITIPVSPISLTTALAGGNVISGGLSMVTSRGICYSTIQNPTISDSNISCGSGMGSFSANLTGLIANTSYYVKAYAINNVGIVYGEQVNFTSLGIASLTTKPISAISDTSAVSGGNISYDGGYTVTSRGVCYSTHQIPTIADSIITAGSGVGLYTATLSALKKDSIYFVKAYAINSIGVAYGNEVSFLAKTTVPCTTFTKTHNAGNIAAVTKTINYTTVLTNFTGSSQCWITQNLGADHTADSAKDITEASAGWYWQFNRKQGYKHDGTIRTPNSTWIYTINENSNWTTANDPCNLLLGAEWRVPTITEWTNADANCSWNNYYDVYSSVLKLHAAGELSFNDGSLAGKAFEGCFWSINQKSNIEARNFYARYNISQISNIERKNSGYSIRCLRDMYIQSNLPILITSAITSVTDTSAISGGDITSDGGFPITSRGICYSTHQFPSIADSIITIGNGTGVYSANLIGLTTNTTYYVKAFATNSEGTAYGNQISFKTNALPTIITTNASAITAYTATTGGNITSDGGSYITSRGICYNNLINPTTSNSSVSAGHSAGTFTIVLSNLIPNTIYHIRAYAINQVGTAYGNDNTFSTSSILSLPLISTLTATSVSDSSALIGGIVSYDGGSNVTLRGVCYSTTITPTILNSTISSGNGTGAFSCSLTGLTANTTYYVRSYATNSFGTSYGNQINFFTSSTAICNSFTVTHFIDSITPETKTIIYETVYTNISGSNKCWIVQNLGASFPADSASDINEASSGWYWMFNRKQGYSRNYGITPPWSNTNINENYDWLSTNDPCRILLGANWRIPTRFEWSNSNGGWNNFYDSYNSSLKIHAPGYIISGSVESIGGTGYYWSSTQYTGSMGYRLGVTSNTSEMNMTSKSVGLPIRCIKD